MNKLADIVIAEGKTNLTSLSFNNAYFLSISKRYKMLN